MKSAATLLALCIFGTAMPQTFRTIPDKSLPAEKGGSVSEYWASRIYNNSPSELLLFLRAREPRLRAAAALRLASLNEVKAVPVLIEQLSAVPHLKPRPQLPQVDREKTTTETVARVAAARALGKFFDKSAIPSLEQAVRSDPSHDVVVASINALASYKSRSSAPVLVRALRDSHEEVRFAAARAMRVVRTPDAVPSLCLLTKESSRHLRDAAVEALGITLDKRAVPSLVIAAEDRYPWIAVKAITALAKIGDRRAMPVLRKIASSPEPQEQYGTKANYSRRGAASKALKALAG